MGLIPEMRSDKNGKLVTRHVRDDIRSSWRNPKQAPAPEVFSDSGQELANTLGQVMSDAEMSGVAEIMKRARRLPKVTASALLETQARSKTGSAFGYVLVAALRDGASPERLENIAYFYSDDQYEQFFLDEGIHEVHRVINEDINGLAHYPQLNGVTNFHRADDDTRKKALALVSMMQEADRTGAIRIITNEDGVRSAVLKDEKLVQFLVDNSDKRQVLLDIAHDLGTDPNILAEALTTTVPLRQGVL